MLDDLLLAFALMLVLEGLMPALNPRGWQEAVATMAKLPPQTIRRFGLVLIGVGALMFHWLR
ncbi:MAG: DUF2065 domain-containing protein [Wenzhouxiangellaceae bacterium]|nr:DUF2065 domain-containing protein [Wenzhouxiangellaceae bacterium]